MISHNYVLTNEKLKNLINFELFKNKKNLLIQLFSGQNKQNYIKVQKEIKELLPQATCIGCSSDGEIHEDTIHSNKIIISISVFENTIISEYYSEQNNSYEQGIELAKTLIKEDTKLLLVFSDFAHNHPEQLLEGINKINKDVIVAGGVCGDNGKFKEGYLSLNEKITNKGVVAISLNSKDLEVKQDYKINCSSIGIDHTITKAKNNIVYEIDNINVIDFYKKYLGENLEEDFISNSICFPLIKKDNNLNLARTVIKVNKDRSLYYLGDFKENEKVKFAYGNMENIYKSSLIKDEDFVRNSQSFFIYSCMARKKYISNFIELENQIFSKITNTSGFFAYGEFVQIKGKTKLLNHSFTILSLSEKTINRKDFSLALKEPSDFENKTIKTLSHLINKSSNDYNEQSKNFEEEKINSQMLVSSQKIFLRHAVHETNTPLSVIMSNIELFEMQYGKNPYLSTIEVALKNIFNIYDDLSYLVKKDQVVYPKKNVDLVDYVRSRIDFFSQNANQIGSQFIFYTDEDSCIFNFNETKLQRIVDNNLTNAIKYTEENSNIYITIKKEEFKYTLTISSCSQYIQYPQKIFKEYYREEATKQGFGLGLSLVKRICDEEDVDIIVESNKFFTSFKYVFKRQN